MSAQRIYSPETTGNRLRAWSRKHGVLLIFGIVFLLLVFLFPRGQSLLNRARRVAPIAADLQFQWMSNEALLLIPHGESVDRQAPLIERNIRTGVTRTFPSPPRFGYGYGGLSFSKLSPDGKRLFWMDVTCMTSGFQGASLDGKQHFTPAHDNPYMSEPQLYWLQDSSRYVTFHKGYGNLEGYGNSRKGTTLATTCDIRNCELDVIDQVELPAPFDQQTFPAIQMSPNGQIIACADLDNMTVTASVDIIEAHLARTGTPHQKFRTLVQRIFDLLRSGTLSMKSCQSMISLYEAQVRWTGAPPRKFRVTLPRNAFVQKVALSPRGDKIAWWLVQCRDVSLVDYVHRYIPAIPLPPQYCACLWTCRIDGRDMKEIGKLPGTTITDRGWLNSLEKFVWLPDDKQVSFVYRDAVWTVPVD